MVDFSKINEREGSNKKSMWGKFHKKIDLLHAYWRGQRKLDGCNELRVRPRGRAIAVHLKNLTRTHRNMCALPVCI